MANCEQVLASIIIGEAGIKEAMKMMYVDTEFQKIAAYWYKRFERRIGRVYLWEDVLLEGIKRFIDSAIKGKKIRHCKSFFSRICSNFCKELNRKVKEVVELTEDVKPLDTRFSLKSEALFEAVKPFVSQLGPQCQILMHLLYFYTPPWNPKNREALAEKLREKGYKVEPTSISTIVSRCKRNLKEIIGNKLDDFDFEEYHT